MEMVIWDNVKAEIINRYDILMLWRVTLRQFDDCLITIFYILFIAWCHLTWHFLWANFTFCNCLSMKLNWSRSFFLGNWVCWRQSISNQSWYKVFDQLKVGRISNFRLVSAWKINPVQSSLNLEQFFPLKYLILPSQSWHRLETKTLIIIFLLFHWFKLCFLSTRSSEILNS